MSNKAQFKGLPWAARVAVVLFGLAGILGVLQVGRSIGPIDYAYFGLLTFLAVVTAHTKVRLIGGSSLSLLTTVALVSMMMLGTQAAILVGICGVLVQCAIPPRRFILHHFIFNLGMIVMTVSMAGTGYYLVVHGTHTSASDQFIGSLIASLLYYLGNSLSVSSIVGLSSQKSPFRIWHDNYLYTAPSFFLAGLLASMVAQFARSTRATVLLVVVPILYLCYYSYRVYLKSLENEKKHSSEMADLFNSTLSTLALAIDAKDKNTHGHIQRVQKYSRAIAEAMKLDEEQITAIAAAALLHDIGKLAIPEYILSKQGPLTPDEMRKMRMHPQLGADLISNIKFPYPVADSILAHHERFDGLGYPNGLRGKEIPLGARILAVADVFDAYTSDRVECSDTLDGAILALREGAGTFFDPEIVTMWGSVYRKVIASAAPSSAYRGIQQATSEIKIVESLAKSIEGITTVGEIVLAVCAQLGKSIPGCSASIEPGEQEGIPVVFGEIVIATICADRSGVPLSEDELQLISFVAEKIAPTLSNAMALEIARREAAVDKLTGLANRRAFEMISASLGGEPFSIVLIDVNSFKAVNDNFGHTAGDNALIRISAHLRTAFPDAQLVCRLGGDEFLVLSLADMRSLRLQIRNFRRMVLWDPAHQAYQKMLFGVSCGVASAPRDADGIEQAMQRADERMYAVKTRFKQFAVRLQTV